MPDGIAWQLDQVAYTPGDDRVLDTVGWTPGGALLSRPGQRPGSGLEVTVGGTPKALSLAPGSGIITDTAAGGSFRFAVTDAQTRQLPATPAAGSSRIVDLVAQILNADARPADNAREVRVYLLAGAEGADPPAPTLPAGHLRIRRAVMDAAGGVALSLPAQRTVALGGVLPVTGATERSAITPAYDGMLIYREDTRTWEGRRTGTFVPLLRQDACELRATALQAPAMSPGSPGTVQFNAIGVDNNTMAELEQNRIRIKTAGIYRIHGVVAYEQGANAGVGYRRARLLLNGAGARGAVLDANTVTGQPTLPEVTRTMTLAVDDLLTLEYFHNYTGNLNSRADANYFSSLTATLLSA